MELRSQSKVSCPFESEVLSAVINRFEAGLDVVNTEYPWPLSKTLLSQETSSSVQLLGDSVSQCITIEIPSLIAGRWKLEEVLGKGSYGKVFSATDIETGEVVAVKIERSRSNKRNTLRTEFEIYERLKMLKGHTAGLPHCMYYGRISKVHQALVMEKLGKSLRYLKIEREGGKMPLKTVLTLGVQGIRQLEQFHRIGYVHRDVKPDNILIGADNPSRMYLIDFGLAAKYTDQSGKHVPKKSCKLIGTPWYCSLNAHRGILQSRRCDLESFGYSLVDLACGDLPWRSARTVSRIFEMKSQHCLSKLCGGLGHEFVEYFTNVRGLKYEQRPDYTYLGNLFQNAMRRHGYIQDKIMDWTDGGTNRYPVGSSSKAAISRSRT